MKVPKGVEPLKYHMLMLLWRQHGYESPFTIVTAIPTYCSRFIPNECFKNRQR